MKRIGLFWAQDGEEAAISLQTKKMLKKALLSINDVKIIEIEISKGKYIVGEDEKELGDISRMIDIAIIAIHGELGEGGSLQKAFENHHIKYIGTGPYQSAVAFSKAATKRVFEKAGIQTAPYLIFDKADIAEKTGSEIFTSLPQPCIIKPSTSGSSYGISKCRTIPEINLAIQKALQYSDTVVAEEFIEGREFFSGIITDMRGEELYVLPAVEAIVADGKEFFDTEAKYDGSTQEICPANIEQELSDKLKEATQKVCSSILLKDYGRIDFIVHPTRGIFAIEVNTLPGMSKESLFPKALNAIGIQVSDFLKELIEKKR